MEAIRHIRLYSLPSLVRAIDNSYGRSWQWFYCMGFRGFHRLHDIGWCDICGICALDCLPFSRRTFHYASISSSHPHSSHHVFHHNVSIRIAPCSLSEKTINKNRISTCIGFVFYSILVQLPERFQIVNGKSAEMAGVSLLALSGPSAIGLYSHSSLFVAAAVIAKLNRLFSGRRSFQQKE